MADKRTLYIRIRDPDLARHIKIAAIETGLDYQALVSSILQDWLNRRSEHNAT